jgi:hypothetical protein
LTECSFYGIILSDLRNLFLIQYVMSEKEPSLNTSENLIKSMAALRSTAIINQYTKGTGDGGLEMRKRDEIPAMAHALKSLMRECEILAKIKFPDADPEAIKITAEKEVMRKLLHNCLEKPELREIQEILKLSDETSASIHKVLSRGGDTSEL